MLSGLGPPSFFIVTRMFLSFKDPRNLALSPSTMENLGAEPQGDSKEKPSQREQADAERGHVEGHGFTQ